MRDDNGIVLIDCHHHGLFQSLMYLFEKRLGHEVYRPFGMDWWRIVNLRHPSDNLPEAASYQTRMLTCESFIHTTDPDKIATLSVPIGRTLRLSEARNRARQIRYVVSTRHDTQDPLADFIAEFAPWAVLIRQTGNSNEHVLRTAHVLCSDLETYNRVKDDHHAILYHQEFPHCYKYHVREEGWWVPTVRQYVNWAHKDDQNRAFFLWFEGICTELGIQCLEHGRGGEDGEFDYHSEVAAAMNLSEFTLSHKWWDGYGMMVHQSYACGRPVICFESDYKGKLAGLLMEDMKTAVFISDDREETMAKIREAWENASMMHTQAIRRFREIVNFDREEQEIRKWLAEI